MERVDVLAELDRHVGRSYNPFEPENQADWYKKLIDVRVAVEELIEALHEVVKWNGKRDSISDALLPESQQENEIRRAMQILARITKETGHE